MEGLGLTHILDIRIMDEDNITEKEMNSIKEAVGKSDYKYDNAWISYDALVILIGKDKADELLKRLEGEQ